MWSTAFTILHILACIFLVIVVLLQTGKGTDVNAVFGGSSQTIFGSSGAGNFLTKLTTATAAIFMATSLFLTYGISRETTKSVFDETLPAPAVTPPATPEQAPATPSGTTGDKPAEGPRASQTAPAPSASASPSTATTATPSAVPTDATNAVTVETKSVGEATKKQAPAPVTPAVPK